MKLSDYTKKILENFSQINNGIIIRKPPEGKNCTTIRTVDTAFQIMAECTIDEVFEYTAPIYDMSNLLSIYSTFSPEAELNFNDTHLYIDEDKSVVRINYANENTILNPKELPIPKNATSFEINQTQFARILQMAKFLDTRTVSLIVKNSVASIKVNDIKNPDSKSYTVEIGAANGPDTTVVVNSTSFKFIPGDYVVNICESGKFVGFQHSVDKSLRYIVATEVV